MCDQRRLPFAHEAFGLGVWLLGVVAVLVALDPAGTTVPYALGALAVALVGGFGAATVPFVLVRVYLKLVVGIDVAERRPTLVALAVPVGAALVATAVLSDPAAAALEAVQPGTVGDHPLRKGERAVTLLTLGVVGLVADPMCLTVLDRLGVTVVRPVAESDVEDGEDGGDADPGGDDGSA